jgi:hypothetical protein
MAGISTTTTDHLIRSNVWTADLKEVFQEELEGVRYVDWITDFPDGDTINIPSMSAQAEVLDYVEGEAIRYTAMGTGNFTFSITEYKQSATYITNKMKQDSYIVDRLVARFVPSQNRAIQKSMEVDVLALGPNGQTAANLNTINGANHRWVGSGTNEAIALKDFALARYALQKANVPMTNLVAIVDPSVEYTLSTQANIVNLLTPNPMWASIANEGSSTGMRFKYNLYGFDIYVSNNLKQGIAETVNSVTTTVGVANLFFSAAPDALPFVGNVRQPPRVDSEYNKDLQRDEYVTTARYGFKLYRPENMVVVLTDTNVVV